MFAFEKDVIAHGGKPGEPLLELDLDEMAYEGYLGSKYDIVGDPHSRVILAKDKEAFLDDYAMMFRRRCEEMLKPFNQRMTNETIYCLWV